MNEQEARLARFRSEQDQLEAALDEAYARDDDEAAFDAFYEATERGHFILCPDSCPRGGCQTGKVNLGWPLNYMYARVRYGDEQSDLQSVADEAAQGHPCPCCHVAPGQWHHLGCLFDMCPYCGSYITLACHGQHMADIARKRTSPALAEYLSRPGTLAYLESLRAEPDMDPATMDMVIALAACSPHTRATAPHLCKRTQRKNRDERRTPQTAAQPDGVRRHR